LEFLSCFWGPRKGTHSIMSYSQPPSIRASICAWIHIIYLCINININIYILCVLHNLGMISKVIYRSSLWYCLICFLICFILFPKPYFITSIFPLHFDLRKSPVHMASVTNHLYRQLISNLEGLQEMECTWSRAS
jgi:hypothetical protein